MFFIFNHGADDRRQTQINTGEALQNKRRGAENAEKEINAVDRRQNSHVSFRSWPTGLVERAVEESVENQHENRFTEDEPPEPARRPGPRGDASEGKGNEHAHHYQGAPAGRFGGVSRHGERHMITAEMGHQRINRQGDDAG